MDFSLLYFCSVGSLFLTLWLNPITWCTTIEITGDVFNDHCNFMLGLGEICTHIAAVLFYLEAAVWMYTAQMSVDNVIVSY